MVRIGFAARALIAGAAAALLLAPAAAQTLQRLTPTAFNLLSDAGRPQVEVPFHLTVTLHVKENVAQIDRVILPVLTDLDVQGDERHLQSTGNGTDYKEIITVVAHHTGTIDLAPVTLQAIDGRDGKAKQFSTNALRIEVVGGALQPIEQGGSIVESAWAMVKQVFVWAVGLACFVAVVVLFMRRRAAPVPAPAPAAPPPQRIAPASPRSRRDVLQDALSVLRAERSRDAAVRVRGAVWRTLGAAEGETLADVLARPSTDPRMTGVLRSLERAAFTYDADLSPAIDDACTALENYLA